MACGWTFALLMALLPILGVSDYRKFAVCLPFETGDALSLAYVVFLMLVNGVAFSILMGCYLKMYCAIRGSQAWNSNDSRIAKRMALLVRKLKHNTRSLSWPGMMITMIILGVYRFPVLGSHRLLGSVLVFRSASHLA